MLDFFRDIALEIGGIDSKSAKEQREEKRENKKKNRFIFSKSAKVFCFFFGIVYLFIAGLNIVQMKQTGSADLLEILRLVVLTALDIGTMVCLAIGKKKAEIVALILVVLFLVVQYYSMVLM